MKKFPIYLENIRVRIDEKVFDKANIVRKGQFVNSLLLTVLLETLAMQ